MVEGLARTPISSNYPKITINTKTWTLSARKGGVAMGPNNIFGGVEALGF